MSTDASAIAAVPAQPAEPPLPAEPQAVVAPLTKAAIFLVAVVNPDAASADAAVDLCADIAALVRAVGFRDLNGRLTCVTGFGAAAWDRLTGLPRPGELHPFKELRSGSRHAVSTPGDLLFHIRATRMDLCFELASLITTRLDGIGQIVDEVHGFSYFDERDLLGFVDGTENPTGAAAVQAAIIGGEEPAYAGGSYVIVQKYLHDLPRWNAQPVEEQERIIGRAKLSDVELDDSVKPSYAHNELNTIVVDGTEVKIVRDNMPFGRVGAGEYGTYFIGYSRSPATIEQMLENMFVGSPPGNYDRILDFSTAVTGSLFFVPSQALLDGLADDDIRADDATLADETLAEENGVANQISSDGSLNIGSLRGDTSR
ncbi:MAG TPA: Dyp-type peroxidase [Streptosporangiaceae bacterium]|nr:Dyp-type peroxidase [Streptosporangiaceae bacterium]